jgi:formylglycine-generating enzyme required for sulfatase activity
MRHAKLSTSESNANSNETPTNPDPEHLVWIKPGKFTMGSPSTEQGRKNDEGRQTQVAISNGFWMSKYETTQKEYKRVMGINPSFFKEDTRCPVEQVSWSDAMDYCGKLTLSKRASGHWSVGYEYRLPTEAEWEYCCRAGTETRFNYGEDLNYTSLEQFAWHAGNSGKATHPVGLKKPNAWGLYDMHGNVAEWCLDWYAESLSGGSVTDPQGPDTGLRHVNRGGGWINHASYCRSADRFYIWSMGSMNGVGFRSVLAPCH